MRCAAVALLAGWAASAQARIIEVGPVRAVHLPSEAAAQAQDGDTIRIDPGSYADCAVWHANRLLIEGLSAGGRGVELAGKTCQGKAIFVTSGNDITVRGITFRGAHVPDGNGAGIRGEGANLTVEASRFEDNENGMLVGAAPNSTIHVVGSVFLRNGVCAPTCAHGIYVGEVAKLRIENSRFEENKQGHHVKSRALRTELVGNTVRDGQTGTASYLVDISNGGDVVMERNVMEKGPRSENPQVAVSIAAEGATHPTKTLSFRGNTLDNISSTNTIFVRNQTDAWATLVGNRFSGSVTPLEGPGSVR
jgi:nitrous oxidase accessory protein NosD